jgi:FMN phosphatase YigB (HAD superfamily)
MQKINSIIFDLGGVLLNLDFSKTADAFTELGVKNFNDYFTQFYANPLFKKLEVGAVIAGEFYDELRRTAEISASNEMIDKAWNAMLLDFPEERINKLKDLKKTHRLFLFSNTNTIHHASFQQSFEKQYRFEFDTIFEKAYYSHLVARRKPDLIAFDYVILDSGVDAAHTLFADDTMPNIEAARKAGLQADLVTKEKDILQLLDQWL